jgi:hypothetical protein
MTLIKFNSKIKIFKNKNNSHFSKKWDSLKINLKIKLIKIFFKHKKLLKIIIILISLVKIQVIITINLWFEATLIYLEEINIKIKFIKNRILIIITWAKKIFKIRILL